VAEDADLLEASVARRELLGVQAGALLHDEKVSNT
jgi:hypothetical protein